MKEIHASWEERNLGVRTREFVVERNDLPQSVLTVTERKIADSSYDVIKIPTGNLELLRALENQGFAYMEALVQFRHDLKFHDSGSITARVAEGMTLRSIELVNSPEILAAIQGEMFRTDRISLDPMFGPAMASRRYTNWIEDELGKNADVLEVLINGLPKGFFVFRKRPDLVGFSALSGLYHSNQVPGLGSALLRRILLYAKENGCRRIDTSVSTNNLAAIKTHVVNGFEIDEVQYVLVRHN